MASCSNLSLVNFTHDVFVNYWPEDTGNNFTSHLKTAFTRAGFNVAMNDMIGEGKEISDTLLSQISESLISVVIFSKNYTNSSDCLDELVKIIESQEENGRHVLPVFLGVEPSDVRKQTGAFGDGFHKLIQSKQIMEKKETWRSALMKTANLSGWHSAEKSEAKIVEGIVECIMKILDQLPLGNFSNGLVGNYQVEAVKSMLQLQSKTNIQFLGIWGMPGIGKTTISKEVFDRISSRFDVSCFLKDVTRILKTGGMQSLTKEMFSELGIDCNSWRSRSARRALNNRRVLIILDDVSNFPGLKSFVQEYRSYGRGSRVILTSRDEQVLKSYQCEYIYKVKKLNHCESRKLFGFHAFKEQTCQKMYEILLNKTLSYCGGLPLALEVLGCDLHGKNFKEWESMLAKLENIPNPTVNEVIKISYKGLDKSEKDIFLDIACVFHGWNEARAKRILDVCRLHVVIGISRLLDKSLITIDKSLVTNWAGTLRMHDLIQQLGHDIVFHECIEEPGNRSRLWRLEDFAHVVQQNTGSEKVEYISVDLSNMYMMPEFFDKMPRLRVLDLRGKPSSGIKLHLPKGLRSLSNKLSYLDWDFYPLTSFPEKFTHADHLVELQLRRSKVKHLWSEGTEQPHLPMLECMDLSMSRDLIKLPDFSKTPNLKTLEAAGCDSLIEIPSSIQHLSKLQSLQMGWCTNLSKLPELPRSIVSLNFKRTEIEELPSSIAYLSQLRNLYLSDCKNLKSLPDLPSSLQVLDANGCTSLKIEGDYIFGSSLKRIGLQGNDLESLPASIKHLSHLKWLYLRDCKNLKSLPDLPSSLEELNADGCTSLKIEGDYIFGSSLKRIGLWGNDLESLPASIKHLSHLTWLDLRDCKNLKSLPDLPSSLEELNADGCTSLKIEGDYIFGSSLKQIGLWGNDLESLPASIKHLSQLQKLDLNDCKNLKCLPDLPSSLEYLDVGGCTSLKIEGDYIFGSSLKRIGLQGNDLESLPASIKHLSHLKWLYLRDCKNLKSLPDLPSSLEELNADGCTSLKIEGDYIFGSSLKRIGLWGNDLESLPASIKHLSQLQKLDLNDCKNLKCLPDLPSSLEYLDAGGCTSLKIEGDYIFGSSLKHIRLGNTDVQSLPTCIKHLSHLKWLSLRDCKNLKSLPDLPSSLLFLYAEGCTSLKIERDYIFGSSLIHISLGNTDVESLPASIKHLSHLKWLKLRDCKNLKSLPDLPSSLEHLYAKGCTSLKIEGDYIFGSSLEGINLSETELESLPASIKHVSHLKWLCLIDCKNLKSLPDLSSSLEYLNAKGCTSLTTVGNFFGEDNCERHLVFNLGGCFNLDENFRIKSLVNAPPRLKRMDICIPGSEVPDWFKYKEEGSSIKLKMLGGTLSDLTKLAFCIVIEDFSNIINKNFWAECNCQFVTEFGEQRGASKRFIGFKEFDIKSEHVLLWIGPGRRGYDREEDGILSSPLALVRFFEAKFEFRAYFDTNNEDMECKIKQCGVSQVGLWETHKREISRREYEEEEKPIPKRFKCDQPPVTPSYN